MVGFLINFVKFVYADEYAGSLGGILDLQERGQEASEGVYKIGLRFLMLTVLTGFLILSIGWGHSSLRKAFS